MTEKIEPTLSADEWKRAGLPPTMFVRSVDGMLTARPDGADDYRDGYLVVDMWKQPAAVIALFNAKLPDSDTRKITRDGVDLLREAAEMVRRDFGRPFEVWSALVVMADALESYLPPA